MTSEVPDSCAHTDCDYGVAAKVTFVSPPEAVYYCEQHAEFQFWNSHTAEAIEWL